MLPFMEMIVDCGVCLFAAARITEFLTVGVFWGEATLMLLLKRSYRAVRVSPLAWK